MPISCTDSPNTFVRGITKALKSHELEIYMDDTVVFNEEKHTKKFKRLLERLW